MTTNALRKWSWTHKWSSIICTLFMLMLCITGLPLIFHDEIDELLHDQVAAAVVPEGTPPANLDRVVASAVAAMPGRVPHFLIWDRDDPNAMMVSVGKTIDANPADNRIVRVDAHTGAYLDAPDVTGRFTYIMLKLHTDMFADLPGKLFLGLMGILFCVAIVSGVVVYAPSMRKQKFGVYRAERPRVVRWLDLHNLAGILLVMWTLVVGFTGVINTWADLVLKMWQYGQLAEMTAQYRDRTLPAHPTPVQEAAEVAARATPGMLPSFIAFPGTIFSSKSHYTVFMRGDTPVTSRLLKPQHALVRHDAVRLAAAAFRRLWRDAAEDHLGAARRHDHHRAWNGRLSLAATPQARRKRRARGRGRRDRGQPPDAVVMTSARAGRQTVRQIFAWPALIGVLSTVGLLSALLGDGIWDGVSWIVLAIPVVLYCGFVRRGA
jgi:uncharacterized iron-regulated membrane protein